jgi:hypothetical protein
MCPGWVLDLVLKFHQYLAALQCCGPAAEGEVQIATYHLFFHSHKKYGELFCTDLKVTV